MKMLVSGENGYRSAPNGHSQFLKLLLLKSGITAEMQLL